MAEIVIENAGPIDYLAIPVPKGGGVVVLRGKNGSGKTHALHAASRLVGGKQKLPVRDGKAKGTVEGLGIKVTIGGKITRRGELEVSAIEGRLDLAMLVDPGIADESRANAARIRALVSLSGVSFTDDELAKKLGVGELPAMPSGGDLVGQVALMKRHYESQSREIAATASKCNADASGLRASVSEVDVSQPSDELELRTAAREAQSTEEKLIATKTAAVELGESIGNATRSLEQLDEIDLAEAAEAEKEADEQLTIERENADRLTKEYANAAAQVTVWKARHAGAKQLLTQAETLQSRRAKLRSIIDQKTFPPSEEEMSEAQESSAKAWAAVENGAVIRAAIKAIVSAERLELDAKSFGKEAREMRDRAAATEEILGDAVSSLDTPMQLKKGKLCVETDRDWEPISELSRGELYALAIDVGVQWVGEDGVLPLEQSAWEGLDGPTQHGIAIKARKVGVCILTGECDKGSGETRLRAEVFEVDEPIPADKAKAELDAAKAGFEKAERRGKTSPDAQKELLERGGPDAAGE